MAYLNWRQHPYELTRIEEKGLIRVKQVITFPVNVAHCQELISQLDFTQEDGLMSESTRGENHTQSFFKELRIDLPGEWILFFKLKGSESVLLVAHPSETEWVSTFSLQSSDFKILTQELARLCDQVDKEKCSSLKSGLMSELISFGPVSNLDWIFEVKRD